MTPRPDITLNADATIMAVKMSAPRGKVKAYPPEILNAQQTWRRLNNRYTQSTPASPVTIAAAIPPPEVSQTRPPNNQKGRRMETTNPRKAPNNNSHNLSSSP